MKKITITAAKPYELCIERGLLAQLGAEFLRVLGKPCTVAILTDDVVDALYGQTAQGSLEAAGFRCCRYAMPHGEKHKNLQTWQELLCFLAEEQLTRTDCVLALGGGVVGDMAGFAAASYLRGVRLVQAPTTLLGMVDSSVGGKTGLNLPQGKNLAGAFYQPRLVLCDLTVLETLSANFFADGVAEVLKYGVLGDAPLFALLGADGWQAQLEEVIARCVRAKAALVAADERDTGNRQLLNLGHTFGHAIERLSGYETSHGHAVAIGMAYAARLAERLGLCKGEVTGAVLAALSANHLPCSAPYTARELAQAALCDKKRAGDTLTLVLPKAIGECVLYPVAMNELEGLIAKALM
ncbi:MAG: 3-dehydroquinate synthase [Clostridia bacterium]